MTHKKSNIKNSNDQLATSKRYTYKDLLPYDARSKVGDSLEGSLKELLFLLDVSLVAFREFDQENFALFDSLVGENNCQIRAVMNCILYYNRKPNFSDVSSRIEQLKAKVESFLSELKQLEEKAFTLDDLMLFYDLNTDLSYDEVYLIASFLLTVVKEEKEPCPTTPYAKKETTRNQQMKVLGKIGTTFARELVKRLREIISFQTVHFAQSCAKKHGYKYIDDGKLIPNSLIKQKHLFTLPCYWASRASLKEAAYQKIPIVILAKQMKSHLDNKVVAEKKLTYLVNEQRHYNYVDGDEVTIDGPVLNIISYTYEDASNELSTDRWVEKLKQMDPVEYILSYTAAHRQYPNRFEGVSIEEVEADPSYQYFKEKADVEGHSIEKPHGLFLCHAYSAPYTSCEALQTAVC